MKKTAQILTIAALFIFIFIVAITTAPKKQWKWEVRGQVIHNGSERPAIWYTDSLDYITEDSCGYHNSDGTKVTIESPYVLVDHRFDK